MSPAEIPRPQSQRVALYEQRFGKFDSGKNAYWSLRRDRPVTLAEGARFDVAMRAGRLASALTVRGTTMRRMQAPPLRINGFVPAVGMTTVTRMPQGSPLLRRTGTYGRMGWWKNTQTGQMRSGREFFPPSRMAGWRWSLRQPSTGVGYTTMPVAPPQERLLHMPTEAKRIDALPSTPPPGPARPPKEPLWEAIMRQLREKQAGPATAIDVVRPTFAAPGRPFASATPGTTPMIAAGFDMKKLALPLALVAGAYVVSKLV